MAPVEHVNKTRRDLQQIDLQPFFLYFQRKKAEKSNIVSINLTPKIDGHDLIEFDFHNYEKESFRRTFN
jgi:hypothetical protein